MNTTRLLNKIRNTPPRTSVLTDLAAHTPMPNTPSAASRLAPAGAAR